MSASVLFYFYAAIALAGAFVLVTARNLIHAAMGLFATLVAIAALYLVIGSEFLAAMQLFVYGGAITVLVLFGLMLAGPAAQSSATSQASRPLGGAESSRCCSSSPSPSCCGAPTWHVSPPHPHDTASIAAILFSRYVLPFEIAGLSLTIALIGSVVIAREDDVLDDASQLAAPIAEAALAEDEGDAA